MEIKEKIHHISKRLSCFQNVSACNNVHAFCHFWFFSENIHSVECVPHLTILFGT